MEMQQESFRWLAQILMFIFLIVLIIKDLVDIAEGEDLVRRRKLVTVFVFLTPIVVWSFWASGSLSMIVGKF